MYLVIDNRERSLKISCEKLKKLDKFKDIEITIENLELGDVIIREKDKIQDILIVERKTVADLLSSIKDGRYSEQSYRLNGIDHENHNIIYLIEGTLRNLGTDMQMAYSSIFSINYYKGFSTLRSENIDETAYILMNMCVKLKKESNKKPYYPREFEEVTKITEESDKNYCSVIKKKKNDNITPANFAEIVLCQIPNISSITAIAIMKEFVNLNDLIEKLKIDKNCLNEIKTETNNGQKRKISKTIIKNIIEYLHPDF